MAQPCAFPGPGKLAPQPLSFGAPRNVPCLLTPPCKALPVHSCFSLRIHCCVGFTFDCGQAYSLDFRLQDYLKYSLFEPLWKEFFQSELGHVPQTISYTCCAQFVATRETIIARPKVSK